jgi:putative Mn2+ efflux pump MntP
VAAARGLAVRRLRVRHAQLVAGVIGGSQALMRHIGWLVGRSLGSAIEAWDHSIVFLLLGGIGAKMIREGFSPPEKVEGADPFALHVMLLLAIATSIDALAAGVTLHLLKAPLTLAVVTIGLTTAVLSALGLVVGRHFGARVGPRLDIVGGVVLIGLGVLTPLQHLGVIGTH